MTLSWSARGTPRCLPPSPRGESCPSVLVVEKAPEYFRGGNTYFTGGIIRFAFDGLEDIKTVIPDMSPTEEESVMDVGSYTEDQFYDDMMRVTQGNWPTRSWPRSWSASRYPTMQWLHSKGVRFVLSYGRQAFKDEYHRQVPLLGRAAGGGRRRGQGPVRPAVRRLRSAEGHRHALLYPRRSSCCSDDARARVNGRPGSGAGRGSRTSTLTRRRAGLRVVSRRTPRCAAATSAPAGSW